MTQKQSKEMARLAYQAMEDKKARDIRIIDISEISVLADYFLIASGSNKNQVQAMVDTYRRSCIRQASFRSRWRATTAPTGFSWTMAISSSMYLMKKIVCSTIWSGSGETDPSLLPRIWRHKNHE